MLEKVATEERFSEEELLTKYARFIRKKAWNYLGKTGQPLHMLEDLKSEATIAFLEGVRKYQITTMDLNPQQFYLLDLCMRSRMRKYVWSMNGYRSTNKRITCKTYCFSDLQNPEGDEIDIDALLFDSAADDISALEMRLTLESMKANDRKIVALLMAGNTLAEVIRLEHTTWRAVQSTLKRARKIFFEGRTLA